MLEKRRPFRWILASIAVLLIAGSLPAFFQQTDISDLIKAADEILQKVEKLRGLPATAPIRKGVKDRQEISDYLQRRVREEYDEQELLNEGRVLQHLGLIPFTTDYKSFMLKLLTEQVGGLYDPEQKTLFIAGWLPAEQQKPVMAHELTHALQDQHFDLQKLMLEGRQLKNDDQQLARHAIFEGDAMAVMLDFLLEPAARNFASLPDLVFVMRAQMSTMESQYEVFRQAPPCLKEVMLFPYGYGAAFLQKIRSSQPWSAVDKLYSDLPVSTEQIMHPDKYIGERDLPQTVVMPDPAERLGAPWKSVYRSVLGEFTLLVLLKSQLSEERASRAAAGWDGDSAILVEGSGGSSFVVTESVWDTTDEADEFYLALKELLRLRYGEGKAAEAPAEAFSVSKEGREYWVSRSGSRIRCLFGAPPPEAEKLKR